QLLFISCKQHYSAVANLPLQACLLDAGCFGTRYAQTSSHYYLHQSGLYAVISNVSFLFKITFIYSSLVMLSNFK
ncbi:MAG: hypothetical protein IKD40_00840, partial [Bacteroidaceae bacterium]|nr:hypothetical protein [Bacteroidaceae bacterium]